MAAPDPGFAVMPLAEDPQRGGIEKSSQDSTDELPIAPDQFDPQYETSRWEIWAYYSYYIGNNGLTLFNFAPTAFQNLLSQAAGNAGTLRFAGVNRTINSIVLVANGISFAIQIVLFLVIGSYADFGRSRPNILIVLSMVAFGIGFGWMGVHTSDKWQVAAGMYIVGLIAYQTTLTFWTAAFPGLARNTPQLRAKAEEFTNGTITRDEYDYADTLQRSRLSNMAFYIQSCGELVILALIVGVLYGVHVTASEANNNYGLSALIAFATGVWVLLAIPWFILEKRRPGQSLPPNMNIVMVGFWQLYRAITQIWRLKQSLFYLIGYFLLGDSLNTTVTVIATLQNEVVDYNTLTLTYILIVGIAAQAVGIYSFWWIQQKYQLSTKTMFNAVVVGIILLDGWGMIGIWTQTFGFHHVWEFWVYQTFYGLFVCPWYSYSQIMISEVTPRGKEFLFFSLFSIIGKTSSFIGPLVSSAIIDASPHGNNSTPFYFLFGLSCLSAGFLVIFLDLKKSRMEQERFLAEEELIRAKRNDEGPTPPMYETPQHPHVFNLSTISEHPPPTERDSSTSEDSTDYVIANERQIEDRQRPEPKERDTRPLPLPLPPRSNTTRRAQIQNAGNAAPSRSNQPSDENPDDAGDSRAGGEPGLPAASYSSAGRAGSTHRNLGLVHRTRDRTSQTAREGGAGVGQSEEERVVGGDGRGGGLRRARLEEVARRALEVERRGTRGQD